MAENSSKDLLKLEAETTISSESKLFIGKKDGPFSRSEAPLQKPAALPVPKSQVLGKVKDFLGVLSESNKKLLHEAKDNPDNYDIEVLTGKESEYIEMDLMLGIADLHTPEAVAAAESAMAGHPQTNSLSDSSSSESEDEDDIDEDDEKKEDKINAQDCEAVPQSAKVESKNTERNTGKGTRKQKPKKRPKIIELT